MKAGIFILLLALLPAGAGAQVVVNQAALDQLAGVVPAVAQPAAPAARTHLHHHRARIVVTAPARPKPAVVAVVARPPPMAKPEATPVAKPATPPPVASLRFAPGSAALLPGAATLLKPFCGQAGTVSIVAAAPAGDPSAGMRLGLSRAFAVRDALAACGVPAAHILPRVLGQALGQAPDTAQLSLVP